LGHADIVSVEELGSSKVTIFRQENEESQISTIIVRGSTQNLLDDIERAIGEL
jgi:T-complex protein 1 subunit theta